MSAALWKAKFDGRLKAEAVACVKAEVTAANVGPSYPKWCSITWNGPLSGWQTYSSYYEWVNQQTRTSESFSYTYREYGTNRCISAGSVGTVGIRRSRNVLCPTGFQYWVYRPDGKAVCYKFSPRTVPDQCTAPEVGNPVRVTDKAKTLFERDYKSPPYSLLSLERRYDSSWGIYIDQDGWTQGSRWRSSWDRRLMVNTVANSPVAIHTAETGLVSSFVSNGGNWIGTAAYGSRLKELKDGVGNRVGWQFTNRSNVIETFDASGRLSELRAASGVFVTLQYSASGNLSSVTDQFGRALTFTYDVDAQSGLAYRLKIIDPQGGEFVYLWDGSDGATPGAAGIKRSDLGRVPACGVNPQPGRAEMHAAQRATADSRVGTVSLRVCNPSSCM